MKDKKELRRSMILLRDSIPAAQRVAKESEIRKRLFDLDEFVSAASLLIYASFRSEVDTWLIMQEWIKAGKSLLLPRVNSRGQLDIFRVKDLDSLDAGFYGIREPNPSDCIKVGVEDADFILVPGALFDLSCNRIGYGKGYYDRLLKNRKAHAAGLAYDEQVVESLPTEPHDVVLDMVVTDKRVIKNG